MILNENSETLIDRTLFCGSLLFLIDVTSDDVILELQMKDKNVSNLQHNLKAVHSLFTSEFVSNFF